MMDEVALQFPWQLFDEGEGKGDVNQQVGEGGAQGTSREEV